MTRVGGFRDDKKRPRAKILFVRDERMGGIKTKHDKNENRR